MMPLRGIVFDKDGTLFDFSSTWTSWARIFLSRIAQDEGQAADLGQAIGFDYHARRFQPDSIVIADTAEEIAAALAAHLPQTSADALLDVMNEEASRASQVEATPLKPLLDHLLARGMQLGVVTNDTERPARAHLDAAGITDRFGFIAGYDSGFGAKPGPGQLLACANAMDLDPKEVLMVGDSLHDLLAAKAAGMRAMGVLSGIASAEELAGHAEVVLPHIGHLPEWLDTENLTGI